MMLKHNVGELYGITIAEAHTWRKMKYEDVLKVKVQLAKDRIRWLTEQGTLTDSMMVNIKLCQNAIEFNDALLKEIK